MFRLRRSCVLSRVIKGLGCLLCLVFAVRGVYAQTALVRGFVTDAANGEALQNVNVVLVDSIEVVRGSATNAAGFYAISRLPAGRYVLRATFIGYRTHIDTLNLSADDVRSVTFTMTRSSAEELDEVIVESDEDGGATGLTAGVQTIRPVEIERVPTPGVSGDLATYLTTLPGVVNTGDQGGQFFIRGGEPSQNLVLLDGILVYQPFHVLSFYSAFSTDVLRQVDFYAGGFSAKYGGRLSSVVDITSRNGNNKAFEGSVSVSPFIVAGLFEGPLWPGRVSYLASLRQSVVEQGASRLIGQEVPFRFNDAFLKVHGLVTRNSRLSFTGLRTTDQGRIGQGESARQLGTFLPEAVRWQNDAYGLHYLFLPGSLPVLADMNFSVSQLRSTLGPKQRPTRSSSTARLNFSVDITQYGGLADVKWGLFARTLELKSRLNGLFQNLRVEREYVTEAGMYLEPDFKLSGELNIEPSLRIHAFPSKNEVYVEPRIRAVWQRGRDRFSGAAGFYHQEIVGISDRRDAANVFTAWAAVPIGEVPSAVHAILGYQRDLGGGMTMVAEGYWKHLSNLFVPEWTAFPRLTTNLQQAKGKVLGLDTRLEVRRPRYYAYISYGLSSVRYEAMQASIPVWFGSRSLNYRPAHDRRHQINALFSTRWRGIEASVRWQFGSGLPYSRALGFDGFILMDGEVDVFTEQGDRRVVYERPFNGVLPTYHRLDLSLERKFTMRGSEATALFSLINAYDRDNIFYLDLFTLRRVGQLPLLPSLGLKVGFY